MKIGYQKYEICKRVKAKYESGLGNAPAPGFITDVACPGQ